MNLHISGQARWQGLIFAILFISIPIQSVANTYSLPRAISVAQERDPWLYGSEQKQKSLAAMGEHLSALPDPKFSLNFANLPVDTFDLSQEPMTQVMLGYSQMFPKGDTRALQNEKFEQLSAAQPLARTERKAKVALTVSQLWLEIYRNQKTVELIEQDRSLFEYLVDVAQSNYTTAAGKTRQQDLVRSQLELTRLEDRLTQLYLKSDTYLAQLSEWLADGAPQIVDRLAEYQPLSNDVLRQLIVSDPMSNGGDGLYEILMAHPKIKVMDQTIHASTTDAAIAQQSLKAQWGVNASYGYREDDPFGNERADFFSIGLSVQVPLFTNDHHNSHVSAATANTESIKTERILALRELKSQFQATRMRYLRLTERKQLFNTRLLREMNEQAEAALTAYTNDEGDFAEVVRARIAELNARIEALNINVDIQTTTAMLDYLLTGRNAQKPTLGDVK